MVVSHILGGIGNQMFQYAAGRALSLANGQQLLLDLHDFPNYRLHQGFELNQVFKVDAGSISMPVLRELLGWRAAPLAKRVLRRSQFAWLRGGRFTAEPYFHYWPGFGDLKGDRYLYGYWQSEKYFGRFEDTIRCDFTFREPLDARNAALAAEMAGAQSVSLHIRRGDYVSNPRNSELLEVCTMDYYRDAVAHIAGRIGSPVFYVFSDDMDWVRRNLSVDFPCVYVDHNRGNESYRDMQLMSLCRHNVIANSSFSWWGAWLNACPQKLVVAPRYWFRNGNSDADLIPESWVRL